MGIFKAYDIRGIYPNEINEDIVYKIARAYVIKFKPKKVTAGMDMRLSSPKLFEVLIKGLTDQGCNVVNIGLVSTPMMYFSVWNYNYDGGLMISASHNPPEYNGVKMVGKGGVPISGESGIFDIGQMIQNKLPDSKNKGKVEELDVMQPYIQHSLKHSYIWSLKRFRVVLDTANAMGGPMSIEFFKHLNGELIHLYPELDGNFPNHEANPLKHETLKALIKSVVKNKADIGIAFDGDADRCMFVDEKGEVIGSDLITALVARVILKDKMKAKILYDVRSSKVVGEVIMENGGVPGRCKVGHSLVKAEMKEQNAYFAGELSGHYYLQDEHYAEAPFFVILKLFELMTHDESKLSDLVKPLKKYFQSGEINSEVDDKRAKMKELAENFNDGKVSWLDGVTVEYNDWWFNVRASNTEPLLRLNIEADTKQLMEEKKILLLNLIKSGISRIHT